MNLGDGANADIPYGRQSIDDSDIEAVVEALKSDFLTQGPRVEWFEDALKEYTGARNVVVVSSGTAALHLANLGLGIDSKHFGIVPAITFAATANSLRYVGAGVQFCDTNRETALASVADFESAIASASLEEQSLKALYSVSMAGRVADLEEIRNLADGHGAFVIEDAAHSIGARYLGSSTTEHSSGSCEHSDAAIFSFHPVKHVCAGEGGAVLTNDDALAKRVRRFRSHGIESVLLNGVRDRWKYAQEGLGFNYRMTELQAALGYSQLKRLPQFLERRRLLAMRYADAFAGQEFSGEIIGASYSEKSAWHLYVVRFLKNGARERAYDFFHKHGIRVQVHYMPVYHHPYYLEVDASLYPGAEDYYSCCLSLPLYPGLSFEEQDRVIHFMREFCRMGSDR